MKNKRTRTGKILLSFGIWIFALGFALVVVKDGITTEFYNSFSIPLVIVGMALIIASNFFKVKG